MGKPQQLRPDHPGKGGPKQANTDTVDTNEQEDQNAAAWYGDAWATGQDTFTQVDTTGKIVDHGRVTTAKINIKVVAAAEAAEGDSAFTSTDIWVDGSSFDISRLKIKEVSLERDGVSYDVSIAKFNGVDLPDHVNLPDKAKHKEIVIERDGDADVDFDLDGNVATVTFDVEVLGDNTLATADAYALALEDMLSQSTILIETDLG